MQFIRVFYDTSKNSLWNQRKTLSEDLSGAFDNLSWSFPIENQKKVQEIFSEIPTAHIKIFDLQEVSWNVYKKKTIISQLEIQKIKAERGNADTISKNAQIKHLQDRIDTIKDEIKIEENILLSDPVDPEVEALNSQWAVVREGAKIISIDKETDGHYTKGQFLLLYQNRKIDKKKSLGNVWLSSESRKEYENIVFDASKTAIEYSENGKSYRNLWRGLAVEPMQGDCSLILDHIQNVICAADENYYNFFVKLLATWVQKPWKKTLCPVLRSDQGTGKKVLPDLLSRIFGNAFCSSPNHKSIFGNFNALIESKIVIELSEALFGGDKELSGRMKSAITDDWIIIERKGKDPYRIKNQKKFFIVSNEDFAIPTDNDGRRFLFLDVSPVRKGDKAYFDNLYGWIHSESAASIFLGHLMDIDLTGFDHRNLPEFATKFGFSNKLESCNSFVQYIYEVLSTGYPDVTGEVGMDGNYWREDGFRKDTVQKCYESFVDKNRHLRKMNTTSQGMTMVKIFGSECVDRRMQSGIHFGIYRLSSLESARQKFCKFFKSEMDIFES